MAISVVAVTGVTCADDAAKMIRALLLTGGVGANIVIYTHTHTNKHINTKCMVK